MNTISFLRPNSQHTHSPGERGVTLIMVLLILVVVSMLWVGGAQIALMSERGARNDRDQQLAWQAAEAGLIDAENDLIYSSSSELCGKFASCPTTRPRGDWVLDGKAAVFFPASGCGRAGNYQGLCASVSSGKPAWLTEDFTDTSSSSTSVAFGTFTPASFKIGEVGVQPAQAPRYIIEPIKVRTGDASSLESEVVYRVTAMGFGPRTDIQAIVQMLYRI